MSSAVSSLPFLIFDFPLDVIAEVNPVILNAD
jgi:hypothetical protein